jgi:hypothetical protein
MPHIEQLLTSTPQKLSFSDISFDSSLDKAHPNKLPFNGILLLLDEPSDQPPHGAEGHSILVPKEAAEKALKSLIGMGINYKPDLEGHDPKKKIGVISEAWIEGNAVHVKGIIWPKDFPEAVAKLRANRGDLGMSMELGNVYVKDQDDEVWTLEQFHFTGATVLKKESAAYQHTKLAASASHVALAAAAAAMGSLRGGKEAMATGKSSSKDRMKLLTTSIAAGVTKAFNEGAVPKLVKSLDDQNKTNEAVLRTLQSVAEGNKAILEHLKASASEDDAQDGAEAADVELDLDDVMAATHADPTDPTASSMRGKGDASSSTSSSASYAAADASSSDDSDDPTTASDQDAAADPTAIDGSDPTVPANRIVNKHAKEHADKQSRSGAKGQLTPGDGDGGVSAARRRDKNNKDKRGTIVVAAATARIVNDLRAQLEESHVETRKLKGLVKKMEAQIERFAERQERRSLPPEALNLLEKSGYNAFELQASGQKLTVGQVDEMLIKSGLSLDPTSKMALKNHLLAAGMMEQGIVNRRVM